MGDTVGVVWETCNEGRVVVLVICKCAIQLIIRFYGDEFDWLMLHRVRL